MAVFRVFVVVFEFRLRFATLIELFSFSEEKLNCLLARFMADLLWPIAVRPKAQKSKSVLKRTRKHPLLGISEFRENQVRGIYG